MQTNQLHVYMLATPSGSAAAFSQINLAAASQETFESLAKDVFRFDETSYGGIDTPKFSQAFRDAGIQLSDEDVQNSINYLHYISRGCNRYKVGGDVESLRGALENYTDLSEAAIAAVVRSWQAAENDRMDGAPKEEECNIAAVERAFSIGELVGLEWKLGVAISSNRCQNLSAPFVELIFRVADRNGMVSTQHLELTYLEFQEMVKTFAHVATQLETL